MKKILMPPTQFIVIGVSVKTWFMTMGPIQFWIDQYIAPMKKYGALDKLGIDFSDEVIAHLVFFYTYRYIFNCIVGANDIPRIDMQLAHIQNLLKKLADDNPNTTLITNHREVVNDNLGDCLSFCQMLDTDGNKAGTISSFLQAQAQNLFTGVGEIGDTKPPKEGAKQSFPTKSIALATGSLV